MADWLTLGPGESLTAGIQPNRYVKKGEAGGGTWGSITGTLSDQTDLQTALDAKATLALDNLSSVAINAALLLGTSDAFALGSATKMWSDLFLASGGAINFNAGDVTITHATNALAFDGASSGYTFDAMVAPVSSDGAALGSTSLMWSDLFVASGGVINWNGGNVTLTHSANQLVINAAATSLTLGTTTQAAKIQRDGTALGLLNITSTGLQAASGTQFGLKISPTINQSGTASSKMVWVNITETALGSGTHMLLDLQVASTTRFSVSNAGIISINGTDLTATAAELNILDGVTATAAELNYLDIVTLGTGAASKAVVLDAGDDYIWPATGLLTYGGTAITATGAELNILDGATLTVTELNYVDGVTSAIQTQLDAKASTTLNNLGTTAINAHLLMSADATHDIGSSTVGINDLHLGSGGVINFDGGDVTLTHSANTLAFAAGTAYTFDANITVANDKGFAGRDTSATAVTMLVANSSNDAHFLANVGNGNILDSAFGAFNSDVGFNFGGSCCGGALPTSFLFNTSGTTSFQVSGSTKLRLTAEANLKLGALTERATTVGTNHLDIFNGTAPAGTLTNGISLYSASGEATVMDAAGNATTFSPHDKETNEWIFYSKHTPTGKVLRIDMERLMRRLDEAFGGGFIKEYIE